MSAAVRLRPFTKSDWYGLAGAEPFADGSEPLLGECRVTDVEGTWDAMVVLDGNGLVVDVFDDEGDGRTLVVFEQAFAARAATQLLAHMELVVLLAMPGANAEGALS